MDTERNIGNIRTKKAIIRKEVLGKRRSLNVEECARLSEMICEKFIASDEYKNAGTILLYKAYNNEVDTDLIFRKAISDGKQVSYPRSSLVDGEPDLSFYVIDDQAQLLAGYKGIFEPDAGSAKPFGNRADICITPAVAFDVKCHRIGYGKAFYDRYLRQNHPKLVIGLAYDLQICDEFEPEDRDMSTDMVITESTVYKNER